MVTATQYGPGRLSLGLADVPQCVSDHTASLHQPLHRHGWWERYAPADAFGTRPTHHHHQYCSPGGLAGDRPDERPGCSEIHYLRWPGIDKLVGNDYPILTDNHTSVEFAELNRLGMAGTMPFILARLLPEIYPEELAQQYGIDPITLARAFLMRSKAVGTDVRSNVPFRRCAKLTTRHSSPQPMVILRITNRSRLLNFLTCSKRVIPNSSTPPIRKRYYRKLGSLRNCNRRTILRKNY